MTLVSLAASLLLLAGISLAFPREGYTRPPWARQAEESLTSFVNRMADWLPRWEDGPFRTTVTFVGSAEEADLAHAGPLNYTGRTVLQVKSDYEGRLYLRGTSLAVYEDGVWKPLPDGTWQDYQDYLGTLDGLPPQPESPLLLPALGRSHTHTVTVDNVGAVGACVYAPYFLTEQDWEGAGMLPVEDAYLARKKGQWSHTVEFADLTMSNGGDHGYTPYQDYAYDHYLDVPEELREELDAIRLRIGSPYALGGAVYAAQVTAEYLDTLCQYDQSAPAAPEGTDPVLYFLNESRRGYCMHYASAAVLLLRAMGVPARYASGFTAYSIPGRQAAVADRAAHAWVEVWVDGLGWYPVEVTPAAAFEQLIQPIGPEPGTESVPPPDATPEPTATPQPTQGPGETPAPTQGPSGPGGEGEVRPARSLLPWLKGLAAGWACCGWSNLPSSGTGGSVCPIPTGTGRPCTPTAAWRSWPGGAAASTPRGWSWRKRPSSAPTPSRRRRPPPCAAWWTGSAPGWRRGRPGGGGCCSGTPGAGPLTRSPSPRKREKQPVRHSRTGC